MHIPKTWSRGWFTILALASLVFPLSNAQASTLSDVSIGLLVNGIPFLSDPGALSLSTGMFTVDDYTISNITAEFVGSGFPSVNDPLQFRLTGIDSISCTGPCAPLEIDFGAIVLPASQSGSYLDQTALSVTVGMDGSLGAGNQVAVELLIGFSDGFLFDLPVTLQPGQPFQYTPAAFGIASGDPSFMAGLFIGCDCFPLQPGQAFSAPDSVSITFATPEPATWTLSGGALALLALAVRRKRTKESKS